MGFALATVQIERSHTLKKYPDQKCLNDSVFGGDVHTATPPMKPVCARYRVEMISTSRCVKDEANFMSMWMMCWGDAIQNATVLCSQKYSNRGMRGGRE